MEATTLDLRRRMAEVLRALDRRETVTILHRGKLRALLVAPDRDPAARPPVASLPGFGMWRDREDPADVAGHVRRLRRSRHHAD